MPRRRSFVFGVASILVVLPALAHAAELKILLPLNRTAYQTNETIDIAVVRSDAAALPAGNLTLTATAKDGGAATFTIAVPAVTIADGKATVTEQLHLDARLLRPGAYTIEVAADDASAKQDIEIASHIRRSSFRLINWGSATKEQQLPQGEDSFGYNLFYGHYGRDEEANFIRAGVDYISNCVMSGGHQMDLRLECDWSDPYVTRGGTQRVVRQTLADRTRGNAIGMHFYDEPGLTWRKTADGGMTPHGVASQLKSFQSAFGKEAPTIEKLDPSNPQSVAAWKEWATWKLGFMDAAWREAQFGVNYVRSDYLAVTQSQYGWSAFTDGYYFNVVRSLPVISGHGGYHDFGPGYFNPSLFLELSRARDLARPNWYLPTWYGNTTSDEYRMEQYLSFMTNIQGMMSPPDCEPAKNAGPRQGIVETNQLMSRLGTIFTTGMQPTRPPVALLYSLSHLVDAQVKSKGKVNYAHDDAHGRSLTFAYLAGKLLQAQFLPVADEDIIDGTLASDHKALVLASIDYLDPKVITALEEFIAGGGVVLKTADSDVQIKGAIDLGVTPAMPDQKAIEDLTANKDMPATEKGPKMAALLTTGKFLDGARPLAKAIKAELDKARIDAATFTSDAEGIVATRQAEGDIEYIFAVNASYDAQAGKLNSIKPVEATITLKGDARPTYDAILGGAAADIQKGATKLRFGPGQMRVWARTARPIGGVKAATPSVSRDLTIETQPIRLTLGATLLDSENGILAGAAPLRIQVIDPLGDTRYDLYRATTPAGVISLDLPLAANDPAGQWKVVVTDLLANTKDDATFAYQPMARCGTLAGRTDRAAMLPGEFENLFRFARVNADVTIIPGSSPFNAQAAERLRTILEPWGVRCKIANLADAAKSRSISETEAATWVGLAYAGAGQIKPGDANGPVISGFAVQGPVILLGNAKDNAIIAYLEKERFLPYQPTDEFPGRGRGLVAWQRDGIGKGQESVTLIASDEAGINEAVGSFYEAVAGMEPLTSWQLAQSSKITPAARGFAPPIAQAAWTARLPDRIVEIKPDGANISVTTLDGTLTTLDGAGKIVSQKSLTPADQATLAKATAAPEGDAAKQLALPLRMLKQVAPGKGVTAASYWGGTVQIVGADGKVIARQSLPQDVTALAWSSDGKLLAGLASGEVVALQAK